MGTLQWGLMCVNSFHNLFQTLFDQINTWHVTVDIRAETRAGLRVK